MEEKTSIYDELKKIGPTFFTTLKHTNNGHQDFGVKIQQMGYWQLMCTISDLLKLCIVATEEECSPTSSLVTGLHNSVHNTLALVLQLLPLHEGEFLDLTRQYFGNDVSEKNDGQY